jgi:hypothetical protein
MGKESSVTHFVKDLIEDLKENRLWPIAVGLALALIAIPVVLSKPSNSGSATTASTGTTGAALTGYSLPELKPAVSVSSAAGSTERKSVVRLSRKNPFEPLVKPKAPPTGTTGAATSAGGSSTGSGSGAAAGSGTGAPSSGGSGSTGSPGSTGSGSSGVTYFTYVAKVKFGELGQTKTKTIQQLRSLPSSDDPIVVFMGATLDGEKAVFLVSADADLKGDGTCKPSADQCVFLYMSPGDSQTFEIAGTDGSLKTYELKLTSIDSKVLDKAPSGVASSKQNGASASSVKHATKHQRKQARVAKRKQARVAKRARKAQAGRYFNAFGRVGF